MRLSWCEATIVEPLPKKKSKTISLDEKKARLSKDTPLSDLDLSENIEAVKDFFEEDKKEEENKDILELSEESVLKFRNCNLQVILANKSIENLDLQKLDKTRFMITHFLETLMKSSRFFDLHSQAIGFGRTVFKALWRRFRYY